MGRLYLIGPRGCGKTTVGRQLAIRLSLPFYDLDRCLQLEAGRSIAAIVAASGWDAFRARESAVLREITGLGAGMVVATGGGIVLNAQNRAHMREHGKVAWLKAPAPVLAARLAASPAEKQRPSLTGKGLLAEIEEVMREREPLYAACAHFAVDASLPLADVCAAICGQALPGVQRQ